MADIDFKTADLDATLDIETAIMFGADSQSDALPAPRRLSVVADAMRQRTEVVKNKTIDSTNAIDPAAITGLATVATTGAYADLSGTPTISGTNTGDQLTFKTIAVSGQSDIVADSATDTFTIVAGGGVTLTTNAATDSLTIALSGGVGSGDMLGGNNLSDLTNTATARTNLGVAIGTNVQAYDADLAAIAGLTSAADSVPYFTGSGTAALATVTAAARTILDDTTVGAIRTTLGVGTADNPQFATIEIGAATDTTLSRVSAGVIAVEGVQIKTAGKETVWIPAQAMVARTTNGAAIGTVETTTNKNMYRTFDFDTTTQEFAQFFVKMPKSWNESTVTAAFVWSHAATTTNFGVVWGLEAVAFSDTDAGDAAVGTVQQIADTGGTTNTIYVTSATPAITIAGTPAAEDWVLFQVKRLPADASDTMAIDARLHGVTLYITTDAATDA